MRLPGAGTSVPGSHAQRVRRAAMRDVRQEAAMFTCHICRFDTELDDVAISVQGDRCICLRCYARETQTAKPMSKILRRQVISALASI
jgi:hypothetical protein